MIRRLADRVRAALVLFGPVGAGSRILLLRLIDRFGWKTVAAGAVAAIYVAARYRAWVIWLIIGWCAAALIHAPKGDREEPEPAGEELPVDAPEDPLPGILWDLIGGAPGVHVKRIVEWLHDTGRDPACTPADVRAALGRRGIPLRPSVWGHDRDGRKGVNQGVHRDDLAAWEEARSPAAPVPLSKVRSSPATTALTSDVAEAATDVATPPTLPN